MNLWHTATPHPAAAAAEPKEITPMATTPVPAPAPVQTAPAPVAATPAPAAPKQNGFVSFLKKVGTDAKKVLQWFGTPANQQIVNAGEQAGAAIATAIVPTMAPEIQAGLSLVQKWTQEIFKAEAIGTAAAAQDASATNLQKSAMVMSAVIPDALTFAKANGLPTPTAANIQAANDALVAFWNAWTAETTPTTPAA